MSNSKHTRPWMSPTVQSQHTPKMFHNTFYIANAMTFTLTPFLQKQTPKRPLKNSTKMFTITPKLIKKPARDSKLSSQTKDRSRLWKFTIGWNLFLNSHRIYLNYNIFHWYENYLSGLYMKKYECRLSSLFFLVFRHTSGDRERGKCN